MPLSMFELRVSREQACRQQEVGQTANKTDAMPVNSASPASLSSRSLLVPKYRKSSSPCVCLQPRRAENRPSLAARKSYDPALGPLPTACAPLMPLRPLGRFCCFAASAQTAPVLDTPWPGLSRTRNNNNPAYAVRTGSFQCGVSYGGRAPLTPFAHPRT